MSDERICLALILGASEFPDLGIPSSRAFETSATAVEEYLISQQDGPAMYRVETLFDSPLGVDKQVQHLGHVMEENGDATDLLIYYVGHGGFIDRTEYFLALRSTLQHYEDTTGLRCKSLAKIVRRRFSDRRVFVLLDCCFAGEALREFQSHSFGKIVEDKTFYDFPRRGTAMLLASSKDEPAISPTALPRTMFCEGLISVLTDGIEGSERHLSLAAVGARLRRLLEDRFGSEASMPEIHSPRQDDGDVARMPLFLNPAYVATILDDDATGLKSGILDAVSNPIPSVRTTGIDLLKPLLTDTDDDLASHVREVLERLAARDESPLVRAYAAEALGRKVVEEDEHAAPELDQDAGQEAALAASLDVSASPSRSRIDAGEAVTWTCSVMNDGPTVVSVIELTDREGSQLREPFDLDPGEQRDVSFDKQYGARGARERFAALGRAPDGTLVSAEGIARVRVQQAAKQTEPGRRAAVRRPAPATATATVVVPQPAPVVTNSLSLRRFRTALREVKVKADLSDSALNRLIVLIGDGERHYRIATGRLPEPDGWPRQVGDWARAVAAERVGDVVMVRFDPLPPGEIVENIAALSDRVAAETGVAIPSDEFN